MARKRRLTLNRAVDLFAKAMKDKLREKRLEGRCGWNNPRFRASICQGMIEHAVRVCMGDDDQAVDVANYAMMLFSLSVKA